VGILEINKDTIAEILPYEMKEKCGDFAIHYTTESGTIKWHSTPLIKVEAKFFLDAFDKNLSEEERDMYIKDELVSAIVRKLIEEDLIPIEVSVDDFDQGIQVRTQLTVAQE
jgi:hypothetical protein